MALCIKMAGNVLIQKFSFIIDIKFKTLSTIFLETLEVKTSVNEILKWYQYYINKKSTE